jgi:hypothetical protein
MPVIKRMIKQSEASKGIIIPKEWLDYQESKYGPFDEVIIEGLENDVLTIRPNIISKVEKEPDKVDT